MVEFNPDSIEYPNLAQFVRPVKKPEREIIGRDREMEQILAAFNRPELANILLLSPAGGGKTSLVQGLSIRDTNRLYLEVDLARMIGGLNDTNELAALLKSLFDEVIEYNKTMGSEIVLFIDEFHQIVQLSDAAVEALKPLLADSSTRGIRVIVATTFVEFREHISANQPLVERLQRINLPEPDERLTVEILRGMANRYGVGSKIERHIYHNIYEYTQRYIPANSQPRKSILVLDAMIGWHGFDGSRLNDTLLAKVIYEAEGVNVAFNVDATKIEDELNKRVLSQQLATHKVADRLHIAVAGLGDPSKPQGSFLFSGSTGVGKTELSKAMADILFKDKRALIRFDMTEYALDDSVERFRKELTTAVWEKPFSIVLFDEIEKASGVVTRILLQVLDDGRLIDQNQREVSFVNTYIVITTNAGSHIYRTIGRYASSDTGDGSEMQRYMKEIRRSLVTGSGDAGGMSKFPPELLGRIDELVPFQPLSEETMRKIVLNKIANLRNQILDRHGVHLDVDRRILDFIVYERSGHDDSDAGGARGAITALNKELVGPVSRFINENPRVRHIIADVEGELIRERKDKAESTARIVVGEAY